MRYSTNRFDANSLRFRDSTVARFLVKQLRADMKETELERVCPDTRRPRLRGIGGIERKSVSRICIALFSVFPGPKPVWQAWCAPAPPVSS